MYQTTFKSLAPTEFMKLMCLCEWRSVECDETLVVEGEALSSLILIYNGSATVQTQGKPVATLKDGDFIGEMSFTTNQQAAATVMTTQPTELIIWSKDRLTQLLNRNPSMRIAIQAVLGADMAKKLQRQ